MKDAFFSEAEDYTYLKILGTVLKHPTILYSTTYNNEKCYAIKEFYIFYGTGNYLLEEDEEVPNMFEMFFRKLFANRTLYISQNTKMPIGTDIASNGMPATYEYFTREVTEEDIKLPNIEDYELVETRN